MREIRKEELEEALEALVDAHGLSDVVNGLARVCWAKEEHVRSTWQDKGLSARWKEAARKIDALTGRLPVLPG